MKSIVIISCLFMSLIVIGSTTSPSTQIYRFKEGHIIFHVLKSERLKISKTCSVNSKLDSKCEALKSIELVKQTKLSGHELRGGKNPGAVLCKKTLRGKVVFGENRFGGKTSFCKFSDGSLLANDSLLYAYNTRREK